jgi:hypothetical protein
VETPARYASAITDTNACSARRRRCSNESAKELPSRSFGTATSIGAEARIPVAPAVAVPTVDPLRAALAATGTSQRIDLGSHQRLREVLHHRPRQNRARLLELLAQPARKLHRGLDRAEAFAPFAPAGIQRARTDHRSDSA